MKLLGNLIAVQYEQPTGVIKLPDWQRSLSGIVIAAGPGLPLADGGCGPMECKIGDRISFGAAVGMESVYKGTPTRIMRDSEVDFVLEKAS